MVIGPLFHFNDNIVEPIVADTRARIRRTLSHLNSYIGTFSWKREHFLFGAKHLGDTMKCCHSNGYIVEPEVADARALTNET